MGHRLHGRALVTGGTAGMGLAFGRELALRGLDLVLVARNAEKLAETAAELRPLGVAVETISADLATTDGVDRVLERLSDRAAPIEVLVNNAGHGLYDPLATDDTTSQQRAIDLMIRSVLELGARAGDEMSRRGHGVIINVGSVSGLIATGGYAAIKAWVNTYSESLTLELEGSGVHVTCLMPGWVRTEFHGRAGMSTGKIPDALWLDAHDVVVECLDGVERGAIRVIPSLRYKVLAFLAEHGPRPGVRMVARVIQGGRR